MDFSVIIPHKDATEELKRLLITLRRQTLKPQEILIVDSSEIEKKACERLAYDFGAEYLAIAPESFNHGQTRTLAAQKAKGDLLVFFTQDAWLASRNSLKNLLSCLTSEAKIAAVYGRQICPLNYGLLPFLHRLFNYSPYSYVVSRKDISNLGLRAAFFSNSFSAYRRQALAEIGWFPKTPALEDQYVAAKFLLAGYKLAYCAKAVVFHGHRLDFYREFKRYTTIGRFYRENPWIVEKLGPPRQEGWRYFSFAWNRLGKWKARRLFLPFLFWQLTRALGYFKGKFI